MAKFMVPVTQAAALVVMAMTAFCFYALMAI